MVPISQVRKLKGYKLCNLPSVTQIADDGTVSQTQFSLIAKYVLIPLWDYTSLRQKWMAARKHLTFQTDKKSEVNFVEV